MITVLLQFPSVVLSKPPARKTLHSTQPPGREHGGIEVLDSLQPRGEEQSQGCLGWSMPDAARSGKAQNFWTFLQLHSFVIYNHCKLVKTKLTAEVKAEVLVKNVTQSVIWKMMVQTCKKNCLRGTSASWPRESFFLCLPFHCQLARHPPGHPRDPSVQVGGLDLIEATETEDSGWQRGGGRGRAR